MNKLTGLEENVIHQTRDYNFFKRIAGNRAISSAHVAALKKSMKKEDLKIPIIVNQKGEVIDGQHRLQARRELAYPVFYMVINHLGIIQTQMANADNKNWSSPDFVNTYVELNYAHYKKYDEFKKKYEFGHSVSQIILEGLQSNSRTNEFRTGGFVVNDYDRACDWAEKLYKIEPFYDGFKRRSFVIAMIHLFRNEKYNHEEFITKLEYQSSKLVHCTTTAQYIKIIEEIYNYKRKVDDKIRFI
jgi:hypothetical protein